MPPVTKAVPVTESQVITASDVGTILAPNATLPFKVIKQVSVNLLKIRAGMTVYVAVTGAMHVAKRLKKESAEDAKKEPPTLLPVINLETGETQEIIVGSVLKDLLDDEYPNAKYVGKGFQIAVKEQKDAKAGGGRRYNTYDVAEIELPAKKAA